MKPFGWAAWLIRILDLKASWYSLFTKYNPFLSYCQITSSIINLLVSGILKIPFASSSVNHCFAFLWSHWFLRLMSSETVASADRFWIESGLKVSCLGIQLCLQICIFSLLPILHVIPFCRTYLPHNIDLHICTNRSGLSL